jgi:hydrogenase maturation protein HypF
LLAAVVGDRMRGRDCSEIARAFQRGIADGVAEAVATLAQANEAAAVILSGGVFQNEILLSDLEDRLESADLKIWTNQAVPPGDGGISLGQAALAARAKTGRRASPPESDSTRMLHTK